MRRWGSFEEAVHRRAFGAAWQDTFDFFWCRIIRMRCDKDSM